MENTAKPKVAKPKVAKPKVAKPKVAKPKVAKPKDAEIKPISLSPDEPHLDESKTGSKPKEDSSTHKLSGAINRFVHRLEGLKRAEEIVLPLIAMAVKNTDETFSKFVANGKIDVKQQDKRVTWTIPIKSYSKFQELQKQRKSLDSAFVQTPRALVVALVSSYDAYLCDLLRTTFFLKPDLLNASHRTLTLSEIVNLGSIEQACEFLIEKEIESVLRESHTKQFDWMENRFGLTLRKNLESWPIFIELTERRNLLVHTDGIISSQYLDVCKSHSVDISKLSLGKHLSVTPEYYNSAFECVYEIGVKLGHVLWRKLMPLDIDAADSSLIEVTFSLLCSEKYSLAQRLLEFATSTLKKHSSNLNKRIFIINLALAYKWQSQDALVKKVINDEDWSDCGDHMKLAVAVLRDDFTQAEQLMRGLGEEAKGITRLGYETWPLFRVFRKSENFLNAFKDIYGEEFEIESEISSERKERKATEKIVAAGSSIKPS